MENPGATVGEPGGDPVEPDVDTTNEYALSFGHNLPNHSTSMAGRGAFVRQSLNKIPEFRTKQQAYRYASYLTTMAEVHLPDEEGCELHDFSTVLYAIQNA